MRRWLALLWMIAFGLGGVRAEAGELPTAASPLLKPNGDTHGWVAIPVSGLSESGGAAILHLPPRRAGAGGKDSGEGTARIALRLPTMPERLAAWDNQLFMVFPADAEPGHKPIRQVLTTSIEPGPIAGTWVTDADGRLPALPALPGTGTLAGFVGTERGPLALFRGPAETTGRSRYSLLLCGPTAWRPINLPEDWWGTEGGAVPRLELVAAPGGMELVAVGGSRPGSWFALVPRIDEQGTSEEYRVEWMFRALSFAAADGSAAPAPYSPLYRVAQRLVYLARSRDGRTAEVWEPGRNGCRQLQQIANVGEDVGLVGLEQSGRVAVLWQEFSEDGGAGSGAKGATSSAGEARTRMVEVSVTTGAVVYQGPARVGPPISPEELKLLAMALVVVMAIVLIFVLRPEAQGPPLSLPKGFALAEPGRRFIAGLIDLSVAVFAASRLASTPLSELLMPSEFLRDPMGVQMILLMIGFGWAHSTLGEWVLGRSIGKALAGCEVAHIVWGKTADGQVELTLERPSLWRAAVRNLVRWAVPPLAISGMSSMDHRHRGDSAAGTVVVVRVREQTGDGASSR